MGDSFTYTVITPCFKSSKTIHRVYDSLRAQTFHNFEWIVVDDRSDDGIAEIIRGYAAGADFPIRFITQQGPRGKHQALNIGIKDARGRLLLLADSDDAFIPETMTALLNHWEGIPANLRQGFVGVTGRCMDQHGRFVGPPFPESPLDVTSQELLANYNVPGEKWGFLRTDVMRKFPFPTVDRYVQESVIWTAIGRHFKTRYVNDAYRIYYVGNAESLSASSKIRFPKARAFSILAQLNLSQDPAKCEPPNMLVLARCAMHTHLPGNFVSERVPTRDLQWMYTLVSPMGRVSAFTDILQGKVPPQVERGTRRPKDEKLWLEAH
jgi:glycosyltransferase involved in cell wall biosynthesis